MTYIKMVTTFILLDDHRVSIVLFYTQVPSPYKIYEQAFSECNTISSFNA